MGNTSEAMKEYFTILFYYFAPSTLFVDTPYDINLLHVSAFRPPSGINAILHSPSAHLLFFPTLTIAFIWE
jgi:hypothetical protein